MRKSLFIKLCASLLFSLALSASAQTSGYTKLNVKNRVQLEIPANWTINDAEHRKRVKELGEKILGLPVEHVASLSARSFPAPSRVFVRVSFIPMNPPLTQADIRQEVQRDRQQVLRDIADVWREDSPTMWAGLAKMGVKEIGRPSFAVESIGGQLALIIRYARTSTVNPVDTMRVTQYHVPLDAEKALITLTYVDGDQTATAAHDRLKSSVVIR